MSELLAKIKQDQLEARKTKNESVSGILSMVLSDVVTLSKSVGMNRHELTDNDIQLVVKSWVKKTNDAIALKSTEKLLSEKLTLEQYLPSQMNDKELHDAIIEIMKETGRNIGGIMKTLKEKFGNSYDSKLASEIVKTLISKES